MRYYLRKSICTYVCIYIYTYIYTSISSSLGDTKRIIHHSSNDLQNNQKSLSNESSLFQHSFHANSSMDILIHVISYTETRPTWNNNKCLISCFVREEKVKTNFYSSQIANWNLRYAIKMGFYRLNLFYIFSKPKNLYPLTDLYNLFNTPPNNALGTIFYSSKNIS